MTEILFKDESYRIVGSSDRRIVGSCFEVYNEQGCGFVEPVYQECLEIEFGFRGVPVHAQQRLQLSYKGKNLRQVYIPDFICYGQIIVEIKAASRLCDEYRAQVHNYLKSTGFRLGLLINFGHHPKLEYERVVR